MTSKPQPKQHSLGWMIIGGRYAVRSLLDRGRTRNQAATAVNTLPDGIHVVCGCTTAAPISDRSEEGSWGRKVDRAYW